MNAERLLAHYERITEAPDAIARLRRFILDLAVRGKLVPQDANDEPVAKRYQEELGAADVPKSWRVLNFGKFCDIKGGNQPPKSQFIDEPRKGYVRLLQIRDLGERPVPVYIPIASARSLCKEGEILIGRYGASVGKVFWAQDGAYNVALAKFIWPDDALIARFAFLLLKSEDLQRPLVAATRSAQAGFNKGDLAPIDFPLPPLAEQHRIVAKVDELMGLCDRLEAAREAREATRDRLAAASLARLTAPDPETFQEDARFALDALPALTTRPDQIKRLRQTILNLAVRGKLLPQDPNDEPASELLKQLKKARVALEAEGKIRKDKSEPPSHYGGEQRFDLPGSWSWARLTEIGQTQTGTSPSSANADLFGNFVPFIKPADLDGDQINYDGPGLSEIGISHSRRAAENSILMVCIGATLGKVNTTARPVCFNQQINSLTPFLDGLTAFIAMALKASDFQSLAWSKASTGTLPIISKGKWEVLPVPLPPLAEQHRIVAKADALMALCDRLEASLDQTAATRSRLLDALLAEALAPVDARELEAAE